MKLLPENRRQWFALLGRCAVLLAILGGMLFSFVSMPGHSFKGKEPSFTLQEQEAARRMRSDVERIAGSIGEHNVNTYGELQKVADLLVGRFTAMGYQVQQERYQVRNKTVSNIVAELPGIGKPAEIVVVGAHYDSPPESPGANDNTSGVAALLELAARFKQQKLHRSVRFVAFVNEEPPWFQTDLMGSRVNAARAKKRGDAIVAMLAFDTIGCYSNVPGSQHYPPPFNVLYPDTGNFIAFVGNTASRSLVRTSLKAFRETTAFPSEGIAAPAFIKGVGWSDHWSYWQEGYPAFMITDTAPFRYRHYHESSDTPEKLDYLKMARVVTGVAKVIEKLAAQ